MSETEHSDAVRTPQTEAEKRAQKVDRYLTFARHALHRYRMEEAATHYDVVRETAPDNMEAIYYSAYCRAVIAMGQHNYVEREARFTDLANAVLALEDAYKTTTEDKQSVLTRINNRMRGMADTPFAYEGTDASVGGLAWGLDLIRGVEQLYDNVLGRLSDTHRDPFLRQLIREEARPLDIQKRQRTREKRYKHSVRVGVAVGSAVGVVAGATWLLIVYTLGGTDMLPLGVLGSIALLITAPVIGWRIGGHNG